MRPFEYGSPVGVSLHHHRSVIDEDDLGAPVESLAARDVDRRGLQLCEQHLVRLRSVHVLCQPGTVGQVVAPPHHPAPVGCLEGIDLPCGGRPLSRRGEEHVLAPHIVQWVRFESRHDEPGITAKSLDVGSQSGGVLGPGVWAASHCKDNQVR